MATVAPKARKLWATKPRRTLAQLALLLCVQISALTAQSAALPGAGPTPIDSVLARVEALRLTADQVRQLTLLRLDSQIAEAPMIAELQAHRLRLERGKIAEPADFKAPEQVLQRIEELSVQIARTERATAEKANDILTPVQRMILVQSGPTASPPVHDARINDASERRPQDSKLVEYEISEAIADRLIAWAKAFALLLGAPLAVLAVVLATLGIRSYADFRDRVQKGREAINGQMQEAAEAIKHQMQEATRLQEELAALRVRFTELAGIEHSVREIAAQVNRIEQFVGFQKSDALTPALKASLEDALSRYRTWLAGIGSLPGEPVTVFIDPKLKDNAYYEPGRIVIAEVLAGDPDVVLREYTHHVLKDAKEKAVPWTAIQSGLSDYLPCSFNNNPLFGAKSAPVFNRIFKRQMFANGYVRNMVNTLRLDTPRQGTSEQQIGEGWSGAFWELRTLLGREHADPLLVEAWKVAKIRKDSPASFTEFGRTIFGLVTQSHASFAAETKAIFERRGVKLPEAK